jgi:hypothetical protein
MQAPDEGFELGWEAGNWTAQLAISNGAGGGPEVEAVDPLSHTELECLTVESMSEPGVCISDFKQRVCRPGHRLFQVLGTCFSSCSWTRRLIPS